MIYDSIVSSHGWTVMLECYEAEWVHRAYTVGLSERGLPEFAIGELPYEDNRYAEMEFGQDAMIHVLEQVASRWESARVSTGTPIEVEAYEGWNILVDPSPTRHPPQIPNFDGVELRWKLAPLPPPKPIDVSNELAAELRLSIIELEAHTPDTVDVATVARADSVHFGHDQRYGPLSPWVITNARAMLGLEHVDILIARMETIAAAESPAVANMALEMTAEWPLRTDALEQAGDLAEMVGLRLQQREDWKSLVAERAAELDLSLPAARGYLDEHLQAFLGNALGGCVLQDVMSPQLLLLSLGGWRSIVSPFEDDPGEPWRCNETTTATLRRFFADMNEDTLADAVFAMDEANLVVGDRRLRLVGSTLIGPSSPPPLKDIVGPGLRELIQHRGACSYVDHLARLIAALCQPPYWLSDDDAASERQSMAIILGDRW